MTARLFSLACVTLVLFGAGLSFLWVQTGVPANKVFTPWDSQISFFPSVFAAWIPLIYLFFTSVWTYLEPRLSTGRDRLRSFLKLDLCSYSVLLIFFLLQIAWNEFGTPALWFRAAVLLLLLFKGFILFRALYAFPQLIQPVLLVILSMGCYLLSYPFLHLPFFFVFPDILQQATLLQIGIVTVKALCLSVMALEMFHLSVEMTKSVQSAFFSWLIMSFTFPVIGFPQIPYILAGLLIIFILRMIVSRLDTRELMLGLLEPTSITIVIKLLVTLAIIGASGIVYWINVKPGFGIQGRRAVEAAIGTLFDGQFGLFCYAPVYWLALFGIIYLIFFRVWDGILLIVTAAILYGGYHLAVYGMLGKGLRQDDILPFIPFLGVFIAVAHYRFGKIALFRVCARMFVIATVGITSLLLLLRSDFTTLASKLGSIQHDIMTSLSRDLSSLVPSMIFRPFSLSLLIWSGGIVIIALYCCQIRARSFYPHVQKLYHFTGERLHGQKFTFYPFLLCAFFLIGTIFIICGNTPHSIPLEKPILLSKQYPRHTISLARHQLPTPGVKGILIVSNLTGSTGVSHKTPLASVLINGQEKYFETLTIKAGKDTAEETLERKNVKDVVAHGRAAIYGSWALTNDDGTTFEAHDYYTKLFFKKPMNVQKITLKLLESKGQKLPSGMTFHIKEIWLMN